jgi:hypothetical protein
MLEKYADRDKGAEESRFITLINKRVKHLCRSIHWAQSCVHAVGYSPDGSKLARAEGSEVVVCDACTGFVQQTSGHSDRFVFTQIGEIFFLFVFNFVLLFRLLLVRLVDCTVTLSDFYSYRLIGKLTAFLQLQEFSQRNQTWNHRTSTFAARFSLVC